MAGKQQWYVWWVEHPDHTPAVVTAQCWEQATVEAARWWEVPWGRVAANCTEQKREPLCRGMCVECGAKMWLGAGARARCARCEARAHERELGWRKLRIKKCSMT